MHVSQARRSDPTVQEQLTGNVTGGGTLSLTYDAPNDRMVRVESALLVYNADAPAGCKARLVLESYPLTDWVEVTGTSANRDHIDLMPNSGPFDIPLYSDPTNRLPNPRTLEVELEDGTSTDDVDVYFTFRERAL